MKTNHTPLELSRELGISIINSKEFVMFKKAETLLENDKNTMELKNLYNIKVKEYSELLSNKAQDKDINLLKDELKVLKEKINNNTFINNYNKAKEDYDKLLNNINNILEYITNNNWKGSKSKCNCGGCKKG